jgi:hypothetical protein
MLGDPPNEKATNMPSWLPDLGVHQLWWLPPRGLVVAYPLAALRSPTTRFVVIAFSCTFSAAGPDTRPVGRISQYA